MPSETPAEAFYSISMQILQHLTEVQKLQDSLVERAAELARLPYEIMPGTPYSKFAIPLEYPPSRDFRPRWGYTHPVEPVTQAWFESNAESYRSFVKRMRANAPKLSNIPMDFDEAQLPSPAWNGVPYCPFDALALYTMIEKYRPKHYLEIGSGITTCFAHRAITDHDLPTKITSIDPLPRAQIDAICDDVVRVGLETCDLSIFEQLEPNDVLFFDGSHRSFMNSDVTVFMIDILPRVKPGVIVHVHDISIPYDYPPMFTNWYWNEQYLLTVYLTSNRLRIDPVLPTTFVCKDKIMDGSFDTPLLDIGIHNDGWRSGGAMWFTHTS